MFEFSNFKTDWVVATYFELTRTESLGFSGIGRLFFMTVSQLSELAREAGLLSRFRDSMTVRKWAFEDVRASMTVIFVTDT